MSILKSILNTIRLIDTHRFISKHLSTRTHNSIMTAHITSTLFCTAIVRIYAELIIVFATTRSSNVFALEVLK